MHGGRQPEVLPTAVVGANFDDDDGGASGSAYVFDRDEGGADNWGEVAKLTVSDGAAGSMPSCSGSGAGARRESRTVAICPAERCLTPSRGLPRYDWPVSITRK